MPVSPPSAALPRIHAVDWLRGVAVVLMIQAHGFDAWMLRSEMQGPAWEVIRALSGIPSRLFLLLVGVSVAIRFETQLARGAPAAAMRWPVLKRGLQVLVLAYLFRFQEWALSGFWGGIEQLYRVDILNAIGLSMIVVGLVSTPRQGRRQIAASLALAAFFVGLGPFVGPAEFPGWLPRPLTSYIGGQRPMAWFPLFPWGAWALVGVVLGHVWVGAVRAGRSGARIALATGAVAVLLTAVATAARAMRLEVIAYPSDLVRQMGPEAFFYRLGLIGLVAAVAWAVTRQASSRFSVLRQLGQTSLLIYWVHVDLCYGHLAAPLKGKLTLGQAAAAIVVLTAAMLGLSVLKTRYAGPVAAWIAARLRRRIPANAEAPR